MKIALIVAYFGSLPTWFQLFLDSCKVNQNYEWFIFSDDNTKYNYPPNVHLIYITFDECKRLIQSKFNFKISLETPQKLCDYKCAYGYIFDNYILNYDWWGHCDLDQIFGNLNHFISEEMLKSNDKLFSLGHLTLYKNTKENNIIFMSELNGKERYKEVFTQNYGFAFDEWLPGNVNEIYINSDKKIQLTNIGADINSYNTNFQLVYFDVEKKVYVFDDVDNSIFEWNDGTLYQIYIKKDQLIKKEFPYVHLQKRNMKDKRRNNNINRYFIIPNKFVDYSSNPILLIKQNRIWYFINYQFFKVKLNSLKYRIKSNNWHFNNVFK